PRTASRPAGRDQTRRQRRVVRRVTARGMKLPVLELVVILVLVAFNGMLAGAELALVSARRSRLQRLAADGSGAAQAALALRAVPERFLATVQVGITLIGALAGAFGGSTLAVSLARLIGGVPFLADVADELALVLV